MFNWKFWKKNKETIVSSTESNLHEVEKLQDAFVFERLQAIERRKVVLEWRDRHESRIETELQTQLKLFKVDIKTWIKDASVKDIFISNKKWVRDKVIPGIQDWSEQQFISILKPATSDFIESLNGNGGAFKPQHAINEDSTFNQLTDVATALGTVAGGVLVIPALSTASVSSVGGIMGVLGVTAISWPIAIGGTVIVGGLILTGGYKASKIRDKANNRIFKAIEEHIDRVVLGESPDSESLCNSLQQIIRATAREQLQGHPHAE